MSFRSTLPAALLAAVATTQVWLARTADLTAWKGGGFGMFSTTDGNSWRWVRLYVRAEGRSEELSMPPSLQDLAERAQALPSPHRLQALADAAAARERRKQRPVTEVDVEVWRADFDPDTLAVHARRLAARTVLVEP